MLITPSSTSLKLLCLKSEYHIFLDGMNKLKTLPIKKSCKQGTVTITKNLPLSFNKRFTSFKPGSFCLPK